MLRKDRYAKPGSDILNTGPGSIDFLHNLRLESRALKKTCKPGTKARRIFARRENERISAELLDPHRFRVSQWMIRWNRKNWPLFRNALHLQPARRFFIDCAEKSDI